MRAVEVQALRGAVRCVDSRVCAVQEEVSIAKEEWELGHLKAIKEEDERRAEFEDDDMLYLEASPNKSSAAAGKHKKSKPKLYSYGGWEFASFDDDAVASFLDDDGSQNVADDTSTEPSLVISPLASVPSVRGHKRTSRVAKTKPSAVKKMESSSGAVPGRKFWPKKRRAGFAVKDGSTEKVGGAKRPKVSPKAARVPKLPKQIGQLVRETDEHAAVGAVTLDGRNVGHKVRARLFSPDVSRVPRLRAVGQFSRPTAVVQHRPLVRPIRSSELGIRPRMVRLPASRPQIGARTMAEISALSPPRPTPILEKFGATVLGGPSSANQPGRLAQIVSSISALQSTVLVNSSSPGTVQYVITTNGRPTAIQPVAQTPLVIGSSGSPASVGGNLRANIVYQVPPAGARQQLPLQTAVKPSPRLVLPSTATSASAGRQSFVLSAPGGDRQSFVLLPTSDRQSYILAPAASQPAAVVTTAVSSVTRPTNFTIQVSPPRLPRAAQRPIQPAPVHRTIQLAPRTPPAANTLPILEKLALQLNSARPAATYELVAHSGELIAATTPTKAPLQQIVYPAASPPPSPHIVRLSGSTGAAAGGVQLVNHMVVGGSSVAKPLQTITMPQFVIRPPRHVAPASSVIAAAAPAMLPVRSQLSAPRIVSGSNLVQVPSSQLSTVIIVDSSPVSRQS